MSAIRERDGDTVRWTTRRRIWHRIRLIGYGMVGPWLSKKEDGTITLGWTACAATAVLVVMLVRLLPMQDAEGGWSVSTLGWPGMLLTFVALYSKAINKSMTSLSKLNPGKLVELVVSRIGVGAIARQLQSHVRRAEGTDDRFKDDERGER